MMDGSIGVIISESRGPDGWLRGLGWLAYWSSDMRSMLRPRLDGPSQADSI